VITDLITLRETAAAALDTAKNENTRTPVATAQCKEAFDVLIAKIRDIKKRYFLSPPLLDSDHISLGLKPRDSTPTASETPSAHNYFHGIIWHELGVKIVYVTGNPADPANKGYRIWYSVVTPGETPQSSKRYRR
jgi:hypothetical protein